MPGRSREEEVLRVDSEVFGEAGVAGQRAAEAIDLVLHVGAREALEVPDEGFGAPVELLVEAVDGVLREDAARVPLAVGAAQRDLPVGVARLLPLDRVHELLLAVWADMQVLDGGRGTWVHGLDRLRGVLEVHDLDRTTGRK